MQEDIPARGELIDEIEAQAEIVLNAGIADPVNKFSIATDCSDWDQSLHPKAPFEHLKACLNLAYYYVAEVFRSANSHQRRVIVTFNGLAELMNVQIPAAAKAGFLVVEDSTRLLEHGHALQKQLRELKANLVKTLPVSKASLSIRGSD